MIFMVPGADYYTSPRVSILGSAWRGDRAIARLLRHRVRYGDRRRRGGDRAARSVHENDRPVEYLAKERAGWGDEE
jgi:hypothetical protein